MSSCQPSPHAATARWRHEVTVDRLAPGMRAILNAVENASLVPITQAGIAAVLAGRGGLPSHVRVIFSDVSLRVLEQAGAVSGIDMTTILDAYRTAAETVAAANPELDRALSDPW